MKNNIHLSLKKIVDFFIKKRPISNDKFHIYNTIEKNDIKSLHHLLNTFYFDEYTKKLITYFTIEREKIDCLKILFDMGYVDKYAKTCSIAAMRGRLECLKYCNKMGCHLDNTIILHAFINGHL